MTTAQKRALANYRSRLAADGLSRFEVLGSQQDRDIIRRLAKFLTDNPTRADALRQSLVTAMDGSSQGNIFAALRSSPMVGADLDVSRPSGSDREFGF